MSTVAVITDGLYGAAEPADPRPDDAPTPGTAFRVWQVRPPAYVHAEALSELAETVCFGLRRLGMQASLGEPTVHPARTIVVGGHLLDEQRLGALPPDAILYNSEQIYDDSPWLSGPYFRALMRHSVWDYSAENVRRLSALGASRARYVPVGYVPELVRIAPLSEEIDVLFYGSVNPRRQQILEALKAAGLKVVALFGVYGEERDRAIGRARVVLNVHFYPTKIFEIVRAGYLFANGKAVVGECGPDTFVEPDLREAMYSVPYEGLVEACLELVRDRAKRAALGERARRVFARRREEDFLAAALGLASPAAAAGGAGPSPLPETLHLGSGKDYRPDCFNVDLNSSWAPDAVCDMSSPTLLGSTLETTRFGAVTLREETFEAAIANDVLEHIPDLATAMTNTLRLLKAGGVLEILVPYDLSHGAWQDPTHVRAFNERSWLYYSDWHWYLGWVEARFDVLSIQLSMSSFGVELQRLGRSNEEILRTPRAVDALSVRLRKRYLQESERREALRRQPGAGTRDAGGSAGG